MKLAKVNWPIVSENDRIRWTMAAMAMGVGVLQVARFYTLETVG
jgi:membrane-bound lytic murein transglycosylase MltF